MSKRPSKRLIAPEELTPEMLLEVFKGAGMDAKLDDNGDLVVESDMGLAMWIDPKTGETEPMQLGPFFAKVRAANFNATPKDGEFTHVVFEITGKLNLEPGDIDKQINDYCNWVNGAQLFVRAWNLNDGYYRMDWPIPVIGTGISAQSLLRSLALFFHTLGSIKCGEFD